VTDDVIFDQEEETREDGTLKPAHPDYQQRVIYDTRNGGLQQ